MKQILFPWLILLFAPLACSCGSGNGTARSDAKYVDTRETTDMALEDMRNEDASLPPDSSADRIDADDFEERDGVVVCEPSGDGLVLVDPDPIDFGTQLVGHDHTKVVSLLNSSGEDRTVLSVALVSNYFRLVQTPPVPLVLNPCQRAPVKIEMINEADYGVSRETSLVIKYKGLDSVEETLIVEIRGFMARPEDMYCRLFTLHVPDPISVSGKPGNNQIYVANSGTGLCVVEEMGIADCIDDDVGNVVCPDPEMALPSKYLRLQGVRLDDGSFPNYRPGAQWGQRVFLIDSGNPPPKLPHHAMVYIRAHEYLVGTEANYPDLDRLNNQSDHSWQVVVIE